MQTKEIQGTLWSTAPSDWMKYLEPQFIPLYNAALNELDLNEDKILLDAGCGSGLFLSMAALTGASIHGIDASDGLLEISRQRLPAINLLREDLEALPFIDSSFDVVTGFNSFQYAGNFEKAVSEAARVVKRKGTVIIGLWSREEDCEAAEVLNAVASLVPAPSPGLPGPFAFSEEGSVEKVCNSLGLNLIQKEKVYAPWLFQGDDILLKAFLSTAPCAKAVKLAGEAAVKEAILESAQPFRLAKQVYYIRNHFNCFITKKN